MKIYLFFLLVIATCFHVDGQDLIVDLIDTRSQRDPGQQLKIETYVKNIGTVTAGTSTLKVYISPFSTLAAGGASFLCSDQVSALAPNVDQDENCYWNIPSGYTPGNYYIIAVADKNGAVSETNENNNESFVPITIGSPVDLRIASMQSPSQVHRGDNISVETYIENVETGIAAQSYMRLFISPNSTFSAGGTSLLCIDHVASIGPGGDQDENCYWTIPNTLPTGQYYLIALADYNDDVLETDEFNNEYSKPIYVSGELETNCEPRENLPLSWDWRLEEYEFYIANDFGFVQQNVESPWYSASGNNSNINAFRMQSPKDFEPIDGWELLYKDFGTPSSPVDYPIFILYNRYTGIIRLFANVGQEIEGYSSANIRMGFEPGSYRNAILENNTEDRARGALDNFDNGVPPIDISNQYVNQSNFWLHADFLTNYDPCVCDKPSQIFFEINLIDAANLSFYINGQAQQVLGSVDDEGKIQTSGRQALSKGFADIKKVGNINWSDRTEGESWFSSVTNNVSTIGTALVSGFTGLQSLITGSKLLLGIGNNMPTSSNPLIFDVDLEANGSITYTHPYEYKLLSTPGSDNLQLVPPVAIEYNNPLGIFNLVETPTIKYNRIYDCSVGLYSAIQDMFRITEEVKYTINPNAGFDIENLDVRAAFVIETGDYIPGNNVQTSHPSFGGPSHLDLHEVQFHLGHGWEYSTDFVPISEIHKVLVNEKFFHNCNTSGTFNVYLKILAKLPVAGNSNETVFVNTYKLNVEESDPISIAGFNPEYLSYEQLTQIALEELNYDGYLYPFDPTSACNSQNYISRTTGDGEFRIKQSTSRDFIVSQEIGIEQIYPVPFSEELNIKLQNSVSGEIIIRIIDINGRIVIDEKRVFHNESAYVINTVKLRKGVYTVIMRDLNLNQSISKRIVKL